VRYAIPSRGYTAKHGERPRDGGGRGGRYVRLRHGVRVVRWAQLHERGSDASIEAASGTPEAGVAGDSARFADTGSPGDGGASWCGGQGAHTFCEDFDDYTNVTALLGAWSTFEQTGGGSFAFDTVNAPSAPNALEVMGPNGGQVLVIKTFPLAKQPAVLRLDFDLRINSSGSVGFLSAVGLAAIAFGGGLSDGYAALTIGRRPTLSGAVD